MTDQQPIHIGDGIYAKLDGFGGVILHTMRTELGLDEDFRVAQVERKHWIALDARTWATLVKWRERANEPDC